MSPGIATVMLSIMDLLKEVLDMARKQYTAEQIIGKLREVEVLLSQGKTQEHPSTHTTLKVGNNAVSYAAVNVFTVVCHGGSLPYAACAVSITSTKPAAPPA